MKRANVDQKAEAIEPLHCDELEPSTAAGAMPGPPRRLSRSASRVLASCHEMERQAEASFKMERRAAEVPSHESQSFVHNGHSGLFSGFLDILLSTIFKDLHLQLPHRDIAGQVHIGRVYSSTAHKRDGAKERSCIFWGAGVLRELPAPAAVTQRTVGVHVHVHVELRAFSRTKPNTQFRFARRPRPLQAVRHSSRPFVRL